VSRKQKAPRIDFAARMQLALSPRTRGTELRRCGARDRILTAGFWLPPRPRALAEVRPLHPASAGGLQL